MTQRSIQAIPRMDTRTSRKRRVLLVVSAMLYLATGCSLGRGNEPEPDAWVEIRGERVAVEIAATPREQEKGLGDRDVLAWGHGMYFAYSKPAFYAFWMKDMRFSIDIVWLRNGRIVEFDPNVPFEKGGNGPTVRPSVLSDAVLEVPAGYAAAKGWRVGDPAVLERVKAN